MTKRTPQAPNVQVKAGWRINEWMTATGTGRTTVTRLVSDRTVKSVKLGSARIITTDPADYLKSLSD